ncbi:hypothetical protein II5_05857 [Bacillus cereus MSX-A1]|nr:hypothetical protein II5_05857 [Bacillus cereus MSX-A1]
MTELWSLRREIQALKKEHEFLKKVATKTSTLSTYQTIHHQLFRVRWL